MKFADIPKFTRPCNYRVNVSWRFLEEQLNQFFTYPSPLQLNPDFQRGHVWTHEQQMAYVEFVLAGGRSGRDIYFNCAGWNKAAVEGEFVCVDGLQRLTAVRGFMNDEVPAYGYLYSQYTDKLNYTEYDFVFHVNNLETRAEVLRWYLEMNAGGTPHTEEEIARVRRMLEQEKRGNRPESAKEMCERLGFPLPTSELQDEN